MKVKVNGRPILNLPFRLPLGIEGLYNRQLLIHTSIPLPIVGHSGKRHSRKQPFHVPIFCTYCWQLKFRRALWVLKYRRRLPW